MPLFNASKGPLSTSGRPFTRTSPWSGVWMPAMIFISVDLPAPFSPINAWTVPACSRNRTLSRATTPGKALRMPSISSSGGDLLSVLAHIGRGDQFEGNVHEAVDRLLLDQLD